MAGWYLVGQFSSFDPDDPYIWVRTKNFTLICLTVAAGHVLVLGLPGFLILRTLNAIRWWSTVSVGFVLGCIPVAVWAWPFRYAELRSSASHWGGEKMVHTMINGVPTLEGWLSYGGVVAFMGACGAVGGLGFWLIWRRNEAQQPTPTDRPHPTSSASG